MSKLIKLCQINPFVRWIHTCECGNKDGYTFLSGFDCQLMYVLDGHGFLQVPTGFLSLRPGTLALINEGVRYNLRPYTHERLYLLVINFDYTQVHNHDKKLLPPEQQTLYDTKKRISNVVPEEIPHSQGILCQSNMQALEPMLQKMKRVFDKGRRFSDAMLSGQMKEILCVFFANLDFEESPAVAPGERLVWDTIAYFDHHYMEDITYASIAAHLNYHPNHINKQFVKYTGKSLRQHLISFRVARATELILFTDMPMTDIASSTGFNSSSYFSRVYQQTTGYSPSDMRALYSTSSRYARDALDTVQGLRRRQGI